MLHSLHFAARAAHYRHLAEMAANDRTAVDLHAFSNLFLQMSFDVRTIERDSWKNEFLSRYSHTDPANHRWFSGLIATIPMPPAWITKRLRALVSIRPA